MRNSRAPNWSYETTDLVVRIAAAIMKGQPSTCLSNALIESQNTQLDKEFRLSDATLKFYGKYSKQLVQAIERHGLKLPPKRSSPAKVMNKQAEVDFTHKVAPLTLAVASLNELLAQIIKRLESDISKKVEQVVSERIAAAMTDTGMDPVEIEAHHKAVELPRVLVVGLLPVQAFIVNKKLASRAQLKYWINGEASVEMLKSRVLWSDHTFIMTKFISHSTQGIVKKSGKPIHMCNGAVTDLVAQITDVLNMGERS